MSEKKNGDLIILGVICIAPLIIRIAIKLVTDIQVDWELWFDINLIILFILGLIIFGKVRKNKERKELIKEKGWAA